jgi:hypothetical protein
MAQIKYQGRDVEATPIDVVTDREFWNEYQLHDGSLIKVKLIVTEILRVVGEYDPEGNPVYIMKSGNVLTVNSPDALKRR